MTREQCKELLPAIQHFAEGGNLWWRDAMGEWIKQDTVYIIPTIHIANIIEDKHFDARKAYALGEKVEFLHDTDGWQPIDTPHWLGEKEYRPKPEKIDLNEALSEALGRNVEVILYQN